MCTVKECIYESSQCTLLNVVCREIFRPHFFHDLNPSGPLINKLKYFRIRFQFRRDIRNSEVCNASHRGLILHAPRNQNVRTL